MIKRYKKKPIIIEAIQWTGNNREEIEKFITTPKIMQLITDGLYINTLEGVMKVNVCDYIIKGVEGEFYPCKAEIFEKTYEEVTK